VRAIARRVARLEDRLIPQEDPEAKRLVELLRKRRLARLGEEPDRKFPPLPPTNNGRPWTVADILRSRRTRAVGRQNEPANEERHTETA
jgi:hypothetical protein